MDNFTNKTATIVYKFLQSDNPKYFRAFLNPRNSFYNTMSSQMEGEVLEIPKFSPSVQLSDLALFCL